MNETEYRRWMVELKLRIRGAQVKAAVHVNQELISLYWSIGKDIVEKKAEDSEGGNFYKRVSNDLQRDFPEIKGFSERNIFYMRSMYLLFSPLEQQELPQPVAVDSKVPQPVAGNVKNLVCRIPWGHNLAKNSRILFQYQV